jgi:hypothetical protein
LRRGSAGTGICCPSGSFLRRRPAGGRSSTTCWSPARRCAAARAVLARAVGGRGRDGPLSRRSRRGDRHRRGRAAPAARPAARGRRQRPPSNRARPRPGDRGLDIPCHPGYWCRGPWTAHSGQPRWGRSLRRKGQPLRRRAARPWPDGHRWLQLWLQFTMVAVVRRCLPGFECPGQGGEGPGEPRHRDHDGLAEGGQGFDPVFELAVDWDAFVCGRMHIGHGRPAASWCTPSARCVSWASAACGAPPAPCVPAPGFTGALSSGRHRRRHCSSVLSSPPNLALAPAARPRAQGSSARRSSSSPRSAAGMLLGAAATCSAVRTATPRTARRTPNGLKQSYQNDGRRR